MIKPLRLICCTTLALSLLTTISEARTIEKSFDVSNGGTLKLETDTGILKVASHNDNKVLVEVDIDGRDEDQFEVTFKHSGDNVSIDGERERSFKGRRLRVTYRIKVPKDYNLDLDTSGGSIEIGDLKGAVNAHTSGGSIDVGRIEGMLKIRTSGGSIDIEAVSGAVNAHTSGGSVKATISKQPQSSSKLSTSGGSITVYLAKDIAVDLNAKTSGGRVSSDLSVKGQIGKKSIRGSINGGGPELILKTSGGNVRVKAL